MLVNIKISFTLMSISYEIQVSHPWGPEDESW